MTLLKLSMNFVTDVLELLIDWTFDGLDIQKAMLQPEPAYKIRHLKMGIRAAGCLCLCDSYIAFRMLVTHFFQYLCFQTNKLDPSNRRLYEHKI